MRPELMNALSLAYLGDAIFEVLVREYLTVEKQISKVNDLHQMATRFVSANAQAAFMQYAIENNLLSDQEISIYKRGRNTKGRSPKNTSVQTHNQSTGFECIIGHLYLVKDYNRIEALFALYQSFVEEKE